MLNPSTATVRKVISWLSALTGAMVIGLLALAIYAYFDKPAAGQHSASGWVIFGCGLLLALAAALVGALFGLIFGIPKTVRVTPTTAKTATGATASPSTVVEYQGNTNLEEISDWLTKILVGAGLVQLGKIPDAIETFGARIQQLGCLGSCGYIAGPALAIAYGIAGFGVAYLWARIYLERELEHEEPQPQSK